MLSRDAGCKVPMVDFFPILTNTGVIQCKRRNSFCVISTGKEENFCGDKVSTVSLLIEQQNCKYAKIVSILF